MIDKLFFDLKRINEKIEAEAKENFGYDPGTKYFDKLLNDRNTILENIKFIDKQLYIKALDTI